MPGTNSSNVDVLYAQIRRRMVEDGEWDRFQSALTLKLNESGCLDDLRHKSKEHAKDMDPLSFAALAEEIKPQMMQSLPPSVKREITAGLKKYLAKQFES